MLTTIIITATIAAPVGYLVGVMVTGHKRISAERKAEWFESAFNQTSADLQEARKDYRYISDEITTVCVQRDSALSEAQAARSELARLTDRDERGRFVRREPRSGSAAL